MQIKTLLIMIPLFYAFSKGDITKDDPQKIGWSSLSITTTYKDTSKVNVIDLRGRSSDTAILMANENSKQKALILLVRSTDLNYTKLVEDIATENIRAGRKRIVIFLGDKPTGVTNNVLLFANGRLAYSVYQNLENPRIDLEKTIASAYDKVIAPLENK